MLGESCPNVHPFLDQFLQQTIQAVCCAIAFALIGEGADPETINHLRSLILADLAVEQVLRLLTLYLGPHEVLLNVEIQFHQNLSAQDLTQAIERIESDIRTHYPDIRNIFVEAKSLTRREDKHLKM